MRKSLLFSLGLVLGFTLTFLCLGGFELYMNRSRTAGVRPIQIMLHREHRQAMEAIEELNKATERLLFEVTALRMELTHENWEQLTPPDKKALIQQQIDKNRAAACR